MRDCVQCRDWGKYEMHKDHATRNPGEVGKFGKLDQAMRDAETALRSADRGKRPTRGRA